MASLRREDITISEIVTWGPDAEIKIRENLRRLLIRQSQGQNSKTLNRKAILRCVAWMEAIWAQARRFGDLRRRARFGEKRKMRNSSLM